MKNLLCLILVAIAITAGAMFVIGRYGGSKIGDSAVEASPSAEAKEADKDAQSEEKPRSESSERSPEPDPAGKGLATPTRLFKVVKEVVSPAVASFLAESESPMSKQPQVEPEGQAASHPVAHDPGGGGFHRRPACRFGDARSRGLSRVVQTASHRGET